MPGRAYEEVETRPLAGTSSAGSGPVKGKRGSSGEHGSSCRSHPEAVRGAQALPQTAGQQTPARRENDRGNGVFQSGGRARCGRGAGRRFGTGRTGHMIVPSVTQCEGGHVLAIEHVGPMMLKDGDRRTLTRIAPAM